MGTRIRVENEIRAVREEVRRALYRDSIEIEHWPAATPIDVLNALNDQQPHVMHFSGHGGQ
ncbi:MAG: CHAT domain-containing protein, partial [Actinomycetota bacterium]|nr:CHAT domain-containing protein [Actinomycetota bacterium]